MLVEIFLLLKKTIKELKSAENEAEQIVENAKKEFQLMIQNKKKEQNLTKEKLIAELNRKGQEIVIEKINNAKQKSIEINNTCNIQQGLIRKFAQDKFEEAVKMIINELIKVK